MPVLALRKDSLKLAINKWHLELYASPMVCLYNGRELAPSSLYEGFINTDVYFSNAKNHPAFGANLGLLYQSPLLFKSVFFTLGFDLTIFGFKQTLTKNIGSICYCGPNSQPVWTIETFPGYHYSTTANLFQGQLSVYKPLVTKKDFRLSPGVGYMIGSLIQTINEVGSNSQHYSQHCDFVKFGLLMEYRKLKVEPFYMWELDKFNQGSMSAFGLKIGLKLQFAGHWNSSSLFED